MDHNSNELREQIKNGMLRILIETFELKLSAQQAKNPPCRLQKKAEEPAEVALSRLYDLEQDLKALQLWCQSCQKQLEKAIKEVEEPAGTPLKMTKDTENALPSSLFKKTQIQTQ
jgi:hypothetical protein